MKKVAPAKPARNTLNPERVLQTACTLVDTHGAAALTMRRLGAELGVVPMAVYNHFPDRDAILDAIAEHSLGKIAARVRSGGWRTRLDAMIGDLRDLAVGHPHVYDISLSRPNKPAAAIMLMFEALDALREAGLSQSAAVRWYHTFVMLLQGFPSWREGLDRYAQGDRQPQVRESLTPRQLKDLQSIHSMEAADQFDQSVRILLDTLGRKRGSLSNRV